MPCCKVEIHFRQMDGWIDRQTDRQTDRQIDPKGSLLQFRERDTLTLESNSFSLKAL